MAEKKMVEAITAMEEDFAAGARKLLELCREVGV